MRRSPLYSRSQRSRSDPSSESPQREEASGQAPSDPAATGSPGLFRRLYDRHERVVFVIGGAGAVVFALLLHGLFWPGPAPLTQEDIDRAVLYTLENQPRPPSVESEAYRFIQPSVVRVQRAGLEDGDETEQAGTGLGTGVVVEEDGTILTNLHVVLGEHDIRVVFADGTESPAELVAAQPEQDLAVIQAQLIPDDLIPATIRSTRDLRVGDRVVAVGFPFGIGPSVTSGVISGLGREYRNPDGERVLGNLIQFDAAANPGNSGGPLVTEEGHVVGIVTAILNPNNQRVFVGIGFAVPIESAMEAVGSSPF